MTLSRPYPSRIADLERENAMLRAQVELMAENARQAEAIRALAAQAKRRWAACHGTGQTQTPWGTWPTCDACDGKGY